MLNKALIGNKKMNIMMIISGILGVSGCLLLLIGSTFPISFTKMGVGGGLMFAAITFRFVPDLINETQNAKYALVEAVDDTKYIQCINNTKMLILIAYGGRRAGADSATVMLGSDSKPIHCQTVIYTATQVNLPENENKTFARIF